MRLFRVSAACPLRYTGLRPRPGVKGEPGGRLRGSQRAVVAELGLAARLLHETGPNLGKSRVHPHTLRHTFGTQLLRNGVDIVIVADLAYEEQIREIRR